MQGPAASKPFRALLRERRGGVATFSVVLMLPTTLVIGSAIDYSRLTSYRSFLQDALDRAALAGATAFTDPTQADNASKVATDNFNATTFPAGMRNVVLQTPTTSQGSANRPGNYNNLSLAASMTVDMSVMSLVIPSITIQANSRASNPIVQFNITYGNPGSNAADWNSVYVYAVPINNQGKPDYTKVPSPADILSQGDEISSNCDYGWGEPCSTLPGAFMGANTPSLTLTATTVVGFALQNVTGYRSALNYSNWYGSTYGQANWFFSSLMKAGLPPSADTDSLETSHNTHYSSAGTGAGQTNCNFLIQKLAPGQSIPALPPIAGQCYNPSDPGTGAQYAAFTCAQLGKSTYMIWWNDMGSYVDDYNYTDLYYTISCSTVGNVQPGVVLTK